MNVSRWMALGASMLALAACGQKNDAVANNTADTAVVNDVAAAPSVAPGQQFANTAAASDAFEIETSRLAETKAKAAGVKKFAASMIKAHTDSTAKLKTAAGSATPALTPDATLTAEQQQVLDSLKPLEGDAFDKAYVTAQVDGHQKTLDALKAYAASGDVSQLKDFATATVPVVTAHLNMAKGLAD